MNRTSPLPRKESNRIISTLASIMVLMVVMIWASPGDAGNLLRGQKQVTSIKSRASIGQPAASRIQSMHSTRAMGVDVNVGGSGGNPTMPGVSNDPVSPQRVNCKDRRLYPTLLKQRDCECKHNPLLSSLLRQRNCKKMESKAEPTNQLPGFMSDAFGASEGFSQTIEGNFNSAMESISESVREVCHWEWVSLEAKVRAIGYIIFGTTMEDLEVHGLTRKVCVTVVD